MYQKTCRLLFVRFYYRLRVRSKERKKPKQNPWKELEITHLQNVSDLRLRNRLTIVFIVQRKSDLYLFLYIVTVTHTDVPNELHKIHLSIAVHVK